MSDPYLPRDATTQARDRLVEYLERQAEQEAVGSRDFGRGFAHAIAVLAAAPVMRHWCTPPRHIGETVPCPDCGSLWRVSHNGMSWTFVRTPVARRNRGDL